jgi:hypothetical protein
LRPDPISASVPGPVFIGIIRWPPGLIDLSREGTLERAIFSAVRGRFTGVKLLMTALWGEWQNAGSGEESRALLTLSA